MVHEVPNYENLFRELSLILKSVGKIFVIEPKIHVSKKSFETMVDKVKEIGFEILEQPKIFFSRSIVISKKAI